MMKVKVSLVNLILIISFSSVSANSISGQYVNFKKTSVNISKNLRSRGEIMENLFIVFDPSYLSYVWPKIKNGVHLNLGHYCWEDVSVFLKDLAEGRAWAYKGKLLL